MAAELATLGMRHAKSWHHAAQAWGDLSQADLATIWQGVKLQSDREGSWLCPWILNISAMQELRLAQAESKHLGKAAKQGGQCCLMPDSPPGHSTACKSNSCTVLTLRTVRICGTLAHYWALHW